MLQSGSKLPKCGSNEEEKKKYKDINHGPSFYAVFIKMILVIKRNRSHHFIVNRGFLLGGNKW
jgi:hypothetical protein